jgi:hypothetical protein
LFFKSSEMFTGVHLLYYNYLKTRKLPCDFCTTEDITSFVAIIIYGFVLLFNESLSSLLHLIVCSPGVQRLYNYVYSAIYRTLNYCLLITDAISNN